MVLVGKGITFDSGGLNLKPADGMRNMHTDMCGGAAVLGAIQYAAMQKLPVAVTALVPAAENAVSGTAMRPSDVITHYGGRTTEIGNTDAEGRLVLADALGYAAARLKPDVLIDIATLTGAMKIALGTETAGYFANDDGLAAAAGDGRRPTPASRSGGCRWSTATPSSWTRRWPTPATTPAPRGRSPRRCSCSRSSASCRGRTWTSPVRPGPPRTGRCSAAARPASAPGCWPATSRAWPAGVS